MYTPQFFPLFINEFIHILTYGIFKYLNGYTYSLYLRIIISIETQPIFIVSCKAIFVVNNLIHLNKIQASSFIGNH